MSDGVQVVDLARSLIGTPFKHQGRTPGLALDCAGVIACVAIPLGLCDAGLDRTDYEHLPNAAELEERFSQFCVKGKKKQFNVPGAILTFEFAGEARHCGWSTGETLIHAYSPSKKVCEHPIAGRWLRRLDTVWLPKRLNG